MKMTPIKSIKKYCKESCCAGDLKSWKECSVENCPLFRYRLGKRPKPLEKRDTTKKQ
jgi:hypothetical protein